MHLYSTKFFTPEFTLSIYAKMERMARLRRFSLRCFLFHVQEFKVQDSVVKDSLTTARQCWEAWIDQFENRPPLADELADNGIISTDSQGIVIRPLTVDELSPDIGHLPNCPKNIREYCQTRMN